MRILAFWLAFWAAWRSAWRSGVLPGVLVGVLGGWRSAGVLAFCLAFCRRSGVLQAFWRSASLCIRRKASGTTVKGDTGEMEVRWVTLRDPCHQGKRSNVTSMVKRRNHVTPSK